MFPEHTWRRVIAASALIILANGLLSARRARRGMTVQPARSGRPYMVAIGTQQAGAAELLDGVYLATQRLAQSLTAEGDMAAGVARLQRQAPHVEFAELLLSHEDAPVAVNFNKGESVHLCLRDPATGKLMTHTHTLMSVVVHEIAHIMEEAPSDMTSSGHSRHSEKFKQYESFLMQRAAALGMVGADYGVGDPYCGIRLPDPRLSM